MPELSPPQPTASFLPDPNKHFVQVAKIEDFKHDSFRQEAVQNGVSRIIGTLIVGGDEETYGFHFDADLFTAGDVQQWLGRHRFTSINTNVAVRDLWPYTTAAASIMLSAPLTIKAEASRPPRCSIVAYTGGTMSVEGFGSVCIDLRGLEIPDSFPLLADHTNEIDSIVGTGSGTIRGGQLLVEGPLVGTGTAAAQILELSKSGLQLSASVGVEPTKQRRVMPGETIHVNGRTITAGDFGFILVEEGRLLGSLNIASRCRFGNIRFHRRQAQQLGVPMSTTVNTPEQIRAAAYLETSRVNTIRGAADQARSTWGQHIPADMRMQLANIEAAAIRDGWSTDKTELEIMRAARPQVFVSNPYPGGAAGADGKRSSRPLSPSTPAKRRWAKRNTARRSCSRPKSVASATYSTSSAPACE